jgi:hypothetical protein
MATARLKRKAKGERPYFFDDPNVDRVVAMVMGLAGEVAVMRDRLDTIERLLDAAGTLRRPAIDTYKPSPGVAAERARWREGFLGEVLRIIEAELEGLASGDTSPYTTAIATVEGDRAAPAPARGRRKPAVATKKPRAARASRRK